MEAISIEPLTVADEGHVGPQQVLTSSASCERSHKTIKHRPNDLQKHAQPSGTGSSRGFTEKYEAFSSSTQGTDLQFDPNQRWCKCGWPGTGEGTRGHRQHGWLGSLPHIFLQRVTSSVVSARCHSRRCGHHSCRGFRIQWLCFNC